MPTTLIILNIVTSILFQFVLSYYFDIRLSDNPIQWWIITIIYGLVWPWWAIPLDDWIHLQITLHKERAQRRRNYELFRDGVKSGLIATDEQFNNEARKVIK